MNTWLGLKVIWFLASFKLNTKSSIITVLIVNKRVYFKLKMIKWITGPNGDRAARGRSPYFPVQLNNQRKKSLPSFSWFKLSSSSPANSVCSRAKKAAAGSSSVVCGVGSLSKSSKSDILNFLVWRQCLFKPRSAEMTSGSFGISVKCRDALFPLHIRCFNISNEYKIQMISFTGRPYVFTLKILPKLLIFYVISRKIGNISLST